MSGRGPNAGSAAVFSQGLKWGFQRTRAKSDNHTQNQETPRGLNSSSMIPVIPEDRKLNHITGTDDMDKIRTRRMLELCHEGNHALLRQLCIQNQHTIFQSINSPMDSNQNTPLHLTVSQNDYVMTCMLLQRGADPNIANKSGITPVAISKRMGFVSISKVLIQFGAVVPPRDEKSQRQRVQQRGVAHGGRDGYHGHQRQASVDDANTGGSERRRERRGHSRGPSREVSRIENIMAEDVDYFNKAAAPSVAMSGFPLFGPERINASVANTSSAPGMSSSDKSALFPTNGMDGVAPRRKSITSTPAFPAVSEEEDLMRREAFKESIQSKIYPIYNAAYLGFIDPLLKSLTTENVDVADEAGSTALMKAAHRGHVELVRQIVARGAHVDMMDQQGNTALIWAIISGKLPVIRYLVEEAGASIQGLPMPELADADPNRAMISPLVAAVHAGSVEVVEYLIDHGSDVNARVGAGRGRTALMIAAWMRRKQLVKLLLQNNATVDPNIDHWLNRGIVYLKKVSMEQNAWLGHLALPVFGGDIGTSLRRDHPSSSYVSLQQQQQTGVATGPSASQLRRASLQDKFIYFSPEDSEIATEIGEMLSKRVGNNANAASNMIAVTDTGDPSMARTQTTVISRSARRSRNNAFRQGMNLDKIIGNNSDMVMTLAEQMPERGTDLDALWIAVFQCVVQLVIAANKNIKHHYIAISAKAIHCASEIIRAIEAIDKAAAAAANKAATAAGTASGVGTSTAMTAAANTNMAAKSSAASTQLPPEMSLFSQTPVRVRIRDLSRIISTEFPKQLMLSTRMAIGVWPPPDAVSEMIREASSLAASCRELVSLANTLGHYPMLEKNFEVSFQAFEEADSSSEDASSVVSGGANANTDGKSSDTQPGTFKGALSYSEYKRQNDLKLIEEMSKRYDIGERQLSQDVLTTDEKTMDADFFKSLDSLLKQFVVSVAELKNMHDQHLKEEFIKATSTLHLRADTLMEEIQSFDLLKDISDEVILDQNDVVRLEASGIKLTPLVVPCPLKPALRGVFEEVKSAARQVMAKGKIASASWPPPNSSAEMLHATIPCVLAVKKLVVLSKDAVGKVRQTYSEDRRRRDNWRRECLQNERVKQLFQMWESQLLGDQKPAGKKPSALLNREELSILEDSYEGLVIDESSPKRIIKGGRLNKLVEMVTYHTNVDDDFMAAFIMTHHSFTTTSDLLDQLFRRYEISPPYGLNQRMFEIYLDKKVVQVRLRVCHVLQHWIDNHFEEDFVDYDQFVLRYRDFVEKKVAFDFENLSVTMLQTLERKLSEDSRARPIPQLTPERERQCPRPILPVRAFSGADPLTLLAIDPRAFLDIDPQEFSRQLTLLEFELFARVKPYECLDQIWDGHRRKEAIAIKGAKPKRHDPGSSNSDISKIIQHTNQLSFWIATNIASQDNLKIRMNILKYFVQVAAYCRELNNLTGVTTVIGALSMSAISRLHKTWKALEDRYPKISDAYRELAELVSPKFQYANYRKTLKEMTTPAIPFLGVYLTDLTFIELGNTDFMPDSHFINFEKRRKVYNLIQEIQKFQRVPFALVPVPQIQEYLHRLCEKRGTPVGWEEAPLLNEDELYEQSLLIEPREEESDSDYD